MRGWKHQFGLFVWNDGVEWLDEICEDQYEDERMFFFLNDGVECEKIKLGRCQNVPDAIVESVDFCRIRIIGGNMGG